MHEKTIVTFRFHALFRVCHHAPFFRDKHAHLRHRKDIPTVTPYMPQLRCRPWPGLRLSDLTKDSTHLTFQY